MLLRWTDETVFRGADGRIAQLGRHPATARILVTSVLLTVVLIASTQGATQAGPRTFSDALAALALPPNIGAGIKTNEPVTIEFSEPMDPGSVADTLVIQPESDVYLTWNDDATSVDVAPSALWSTDERYVMTVAADSLTAEGHEIGEVMEVTFTTETAPAVRRFLIVRSGSADQASDASLARLDPASAEAAAAAALEDVSTATTIDIEFTTAMDREAVEDSFTIQPYVPGTFAWEGTVLSFGPEERLETGTEYTISLVGAIDSRGNRIGREAVFTFTTDAAAQVVRVLPAAGAADVTADTISVWFSQPMAVDATTASFGVFDIQGAATAVPGNVSWDDSGTQLTFTPNAPLGAGRLHAIRLGSGATDMDGNPVQGEWRFTTAAAAATPALDGAAPNRPAYAPPAYAPGSPLEGYALEQINSARAAYGFPPLGLDPAVSAAASGHAWDQLQYGYYDHNSLDGRTARTRLIQAGASFGLNGENQCHHYGMSAIDTLNWCHSAFMAEPWPGHWNHIGNILGPNYTRVGIGIADGGGRVVITWDFVQ